LPAIVRAHENARAALMAGRYERIQCVNGALALLTTPATEDGLPVLAGLKAPRMARPLRAPALTPAARRKDVAIVAGISPGEHE
jgi:hypothetical protein